MLFLNLVENYKGIFIFYMIISANFLGNIFGCTTQKIFKENMLVKHILGFLTLFVFVALIDEDKSNINTNKLDEYIFFKKLGAAIILYFVFILSTRINYIYFIVFILMIAITYLLNNYTQSLDEDKFENRINIISKIALWIGRTSLIVLVLGFILYYIEKKKEYKSEFKLKTFILGNLTCKGIK